MKHVFSILLSFCLATSGSAWAKCEPNLVLDGCRGHGCIAHAMNTSNAPGLPALPGQLVFGGERFAIDQGTWNDLNVGGGLTTALLDPVIEGLPSKLGKMRLRWELERPLLNPKIIRERQAAIDALLENDGKLLAQLTALFEKLEGDGSTREIETTGNIVLNIQNVANKPLESRRRTLHINPEQALRKLADPDLWKGAFGDGYVLAQNLLIAATAFTTAKLPFVTMSHLSELAPVAMLVLANLPVAAGRAMLNQSGFDEAQHLVKIFERTNSKIVAGLRGAGSNVLGGIANDLDMAHDPNRPDSLVPARRAMKRAMILSGAFFLPTYIKKTLATLKLNDSLENIIVYLDALSELELLVGLARYKQKNATSHRFVQIADHGDLHLTDAHSPNLLLRNKATGSPSRPTQFHFDPSRRVELVTGANAEGKSTGLRTEAQIALASQLGFAVPARGELSPFVYITGNKVNDNVGMSLMMAQSERIAQMLRAAIDLTARGHRVMLKFDEPFDGTSPEERRALVAAIIIYTGQQPNLYASIATHERSLIDLVNGLAAPKPIPAAAASAPDSISQQYASALSVVRNVHYHDYIKHEGGATTRNALQIAAQMGMPEEVLSIARDILQASGN